MNQSIHPMDLKRVEATAKLNQDRRGEFGQFLTPWNIATFMASMFSPRSDNLVLDAGAGIGSLSLAFLEKYPQSRIEAWEIDPVLQKYLSSTIPEKNIKIYKTDFIEAAVNILQFEPGRKYNRAILNPPYKKISNKGIHRNLIKQVGIETVNLYSAFVSLAILLMENKGEIVAIIPRSFCNGLYYHPFRKLILSQCSIDMIHVFKSRNNAFKDDSVLQENIILKLVRGGTQKDIVITESNDASFSDQMVNIAPFDNIIRSGDTQHYIHIPTTDSMNKKQSKLFTHSLEDLKLSVSTGPVVDFRVREHCSKNISKGSVPLIYAHNFKNGLFTYPVENKKPTAIAVNDATERWLMPSGFYVVTKRFSSKEERKRIVAFVFNPELIKTSMVGFENHLNVFHFNKAGINQQLAYGLYVFLNSSAVDKHFRLFSGHTQVNATDLRNMKYPSSIELISLGENILKILEKKNEILTQENVDKLIEELENNGNKTKKIK